MAASAKGQGHGAYGAAGLGAQGHLDALPVLFFYQRGDLHIRQGDHGGDDLPDVVPVRARLLGQFVVHPGPDELAALLVGQRREDAGGGVQALAGDGGEDGLLHVRRAGAAADQVGGGLEGFVALAHEAKAAGVVHDGGQQGAGVGLAHGDAHGGQQAGDHLAGAGEPGAGQHEGPLAGHVAAEVMIHYQQLGAGGLGGGLGAAHALPFARVHHQEAVTLAAQALGGLDEGVLGDALKKELEARGGLVGVGNLDPGAQVREGVVQGGLAAQAVAVGVHVGAKHYLLGGQEASGGLTEAGLQAVLLGELVVGGEGGEELLDDAGRDAPDQLALVAKDGEGLGEAPAAQGHGGAVAGGPKDADGDR